MLDLAINHEAQLQIKYQKTLLDERYKYFRRNPGYEYYISIAKDCINGIQYVSLDPSGEVIGYLSVKFNRLTRTAYDMEAIKFIEGKSNDFSKDMGVFDINLFNDFDINRLVWSVIIGNPAERFYNQLVKTCGVKIIGTFRNEVMLSDGKLYDLKYYEVMKDDFFRAIKNNGATVNNYRGGEKI